MAHAAIVPVSAVQRAPGRGIPLRRAEGGEQVKRGQSLLEATLVLLVFFGLLLGVIDCGQVLYSHQVLQARVQSAVRWATLHPFDGTGDQVTNMILYDHPSPRAADGFLGLKRDNVQVRYQAEDNLLTVAIVNYESHFFSPWIAKAVISPRPVIVTAPMAYRPQ